MCKINGIQENLLINHSHTFFEGGIPLERVYSIFKKNANKLIFFNPFLIGFLNIFIKKRQLIHKVYTMLAASIYFIIQFKRLLYFKMNKKRVRNQEMSQQN